MHTQTVHFRYQLPSFTSSASLYQRNEWALPESLRNYIFSGRLPPPPVMRVVCVIAPPLPNPTSFVVIVPYSRDSREVELYLWYCWRCLFRVLIRMPVMLTPSGAGLEVGNVIRVCGRWSNADEERRQCFIFSGTSKIFGVFYFPRNNRHSFKRSNTFLYFLFVIYFFNIPVCVQNSNTISCRILITKGMSFCCTSDRLLAGGADRHDQMEAQRTWR